MKEFCLNIRGKYLFQSSGPWCAMVLHGKASYAGFDIENYCSCCFRKHLFSPYELFSVGGINPSQILLKQWLKVEVRLDKYQYSMLLPVLTRDHCLLKRIPKRHIQHVFIYQLTWIIQVEHEKHDLLIISIFQST